VKVPKVLTAHDTGIQLIAAVNNFDALFTISEAVKTDLSERYPEMRTTTIYNGIVFKDVVQKFCYDQQPFRMLQISRLYHKKKGQDILLKALQHVNTVLGAGEVTVDFIGDGTSMQYLVGLAEDLGISKWCQFLGERPRSYIYENLHTYDLLVQPSRFEGFGLTVVEAMAAQVPVLVSDIEGPMEIIKNGQYGYFFRSEDSEDCAKKIVDIIRLPKDQGFKREMEGICAYARDNFDISLTAARYLHEYRKIIYSDNEQL
jgi:glycosyltransferase involved in cell wall biosynthesis